MNCAKASAFRDAASFSIANYVLLFRPVEGGIEVARVIHGSRDMQNRVIAQRIEHPSPP